MSTPSAQSGPRVEGSGTRLVIQTHQQNILKTFTRSRSGFLIPTHNSAIPESPNVCQIRVDWADALDVPLFYGREAGRTLLSQWTIEAQCRVVSVLGMGGIGKSALATRVMHQVAEQFEVVIWRSLRNSPSCEVLVDDCLQVLAPQVLLEKPTSFQRHMHLFMEQLRTQRVLLVLDNLEVLLVEGTGTGRIHVDFDNYARLLQQMGETALSSKGSPCFLLHSNSTSSSVTISSSSCSPGCRSTTKVKYVGSAISVKSQLC